MLRSLCTSMYTRTHTHVIVYIYIYIYIYIHTQGGSNMTGTDCGLFTHNQSLSYLNHFVYKGKVFPLQVRCGPEGA